MEIKHYIYLDKDSINQIYSQLPNAIIPAKITTTDSINGMINPEIGSSGLLKTHLAAKVDASHETQEEYNTIVTLENKVDFILKQLIKKVEFLADILNQKNKFTNALVACQSIFRFIRAYDEDEQRFVLQSEIIGNPYKYTNLSFNFASINNLQYCGDDVDLMNYALEYNSYYVDMFFSGSKMTRGVRHLTNNIKYNKDFMLFVLGEITFEGHNIYCLKPYAIWRMTDRNM